MWELVSRQTPYEHEDWGPNGRVLRKRVSEGLRPDMSVIRSEMYHGTYVALMQRCWHGDPEVRPTFNVIFDLLRSMDIR